MRRNINNVLSSAVVTALAIAPKINVGAVVIRGWVVPPHIPFISCAGPAESAPASYGSLLRVNTLLLTDSRSHELFRLRVTSCSPSCYRRPLHLYHALNRPVIRW